MVIAVAEGKVSHVIVAAKTQETGILLSIGMGHKLLQTK